MKKLINLPLFSNYRFSNYLGEVSFFIFNNLYLPKLSGNTKVNDPLFLEKGIKSILRKFPLWAKGHFLLSQLELQNKNYAKSYVSFYAAKFLKYNLNEMQLLEGKIRLRVGESAKAIEILQQVFAKCDVAQQMEVAEELVAALMQENEHAEISRILKVIKEKQELSPALKIVEEFVYSKTI